MRDFRGKTAVVTGAGSGIGRGMAVAFARAGMRVVVSDIDLHSCEEVARGIATEGGEAIAARTDVSRLEDVQALAATAEKAFGRVHLLCNNAGVLALKHGPDASHRDWQWMIGVNLWGVVHGMEAFLPAMLAHREECRIVNTSSMNGIIPCMYSALYSTTKYAILGLSETYANELKGSNVGISILCPGKVETRIGESERSRPEDLVNASADPGRKYRRSMVYDISPGLDPLEVGEIVLNGIRLGQLHIFTDMKVKPYIEERHRRMMAEFDHLAAWQSAR